MKKNDYRSPIIALGLALLASLTAFAQSEKIAIKRWVEPNQTVRLKMVQELEIEISFEGDLPAGAGPAEPIKMVSRYTFALSQKNGAPDKEGNIASELTYDKVSSETMMNDQPMQ